MPKMSRTEAFVRLPGVTGNLGRNMSPDPALAFALVLLFRG
jgi:hypothetical protein